jgi:hypothetical protein
MGGYMDLRRSLVVAKPYEDVRQFIEHDFFPKLRERRVGAWIEVIGPRVASNLEKSVQLLKEELRADDAISAAPAADSAGRSSS